MQLKSLYLHNFRLYEEAYFEFSPKINIIHGPNAIGKTSLVEAVYFLMTGRSFRTHQVANLIRAGESYFYLEACFEKHGVEQYLKISFKGKERKIFLNNTRYPSSSSLMGLLLGVIFSPSDIDLIKGAPQGRRQFMDDQLAQIDPLYLYHMNRYHRAMRQRNCLLKGKNVRTIHSWEHEMALSAAYILQKRLELIYELQPLSKKLYLSIAEERSQLSLSYRSTCKMIGNQSELIQSYLELYEKNRHREMSAACTLIGPHKDDLAICIGDQEARYFASEGQSRSCAAALRLAEWERLKAISGVMPLMLLDDISTSLDQKRSERLFMELADLGQTFITVTEVSESQVMGHFISLTNDRDANDRGG